jgi:hypothetical protein
VKVLRCFGSFFYDLFKLSWQSLFISFNIGFLPRYILDQVLSVWTPSSYPLSGALPFFSICYALLAMPEYWKDNLFYNKCVYILLLHETYICHDQCIIFFYRDI